MLDTDWSKVTTCTGAAQNYHGLLVCRIMLGVTEAGKYHFQMPRSSKSLARGADIRDIG